MFAWVGTYPRGTVSKTSSKRWTGGGRLPVKSEKAPVTLVPRKRCYCHASPGAIPGTSFDVEPVDEWNGEDIDAASLISQVKFNDVGLVPAVAQQWDTGEVLMMAWMSADSIRETMHGGRAVYYSRSRKELWRKGDTSGQIQVLRDMILDCDGDTILVKVDQHGTACHTGRRSCFYKAFRPPIGEEQIIADVIIDPKELYGK